MKKFSLEEHVYMPGNVDNPFMYMSRSAVYVLCSDYEGLPMALTEAAACSCPAVSCDMRSGAREILAPKTEWSAHTDDIEIAEYGILHKPLIIQAERILPRMTETRRRDSLRKLFGKCLRMRSFAWDIQPRVTSVLTDFHLRG